MLRKFTSSGALTLCVTQHAGRRALKARAAADPVKRVGVINLHGGGFILGSGTDDARWACAVVESLDAVVFSVNYRLAPGYPFPTPVEDTLDSILQIHARAGEFNVDPNRLLLSGFSAGGTLSLAAWVILQDPSRWGYVLSSSPSIAGLALFYPLLDFTTSRPVKRRLCVKPHETLPKRLMPLEYMERLPPVHLCLCEMDMLLTEGLKFADNLREAGVTVTSRVVLGEKHAWDKPPPFAPKASVSVEYQAAIVAMRHWLSDDGAKLTRADVGTVNDQTRVADDAPLDTRSRVERGERDEGEGEEKREKILLPGY
ncbi:Arylesterase like protein [Verticillium longisporum]|nr:Arylesterase like protein [Verticillium longisporum]